MMPGIFFIRIFETETGAAADPRTNRDAPPQRPSRQQMLFAAGSSLETKAAFGLGLASGSDCAGAVSGGAETAKASEFSGP